MTDFSRRVFNRMKSTETSTKIIQNQMRVVQALNQFANDPQKGNIMIEVPFEPKTQWKLLGLPELDNHNETRVNTNQSKKKFFWYDGFQILRNEHRKQYRFNWIKGPKYEAIANNVQDDQTYTYNLVTSGSPPSSRQRQTNNRANKETTSQRQHKDRDRAVEDSVVSESQSSSGTAVETRTDIQAID